METGDPRQVWRARIEPWAGRGPQAGTGIGFMLLSVFCFVKCPNLDSAVFGEIEAMIWISH